MATSAGRAGGAFGSETSVSGRFRIIRALSAAAVLFAALAAPATASAGVTQLLPTNDTFTIAQPAAKRDCTRRQHGRGVATRSWTAGADGAAQIRLLGSARDDWDLALFNAKGRRLDASQAWGANEVTQAVVRKGEAITIQACRLKGASTRIPLLISPVAAKLAKPGAAQPTQSLIEIPIQGQADVAKLTALGLNLNEVAAHGRQQAILTGPDQAAQLTAAGFTYRTLIPNLAVAERSYRAREVQAAQAGPSALPSGRNGYRHYPDIQADLKKIVADHPALARPVTLPKKSYQGRDIQGIEVTDSVGAADDSKPIFFLMGAHHAREWPSAEIPVELGLYLTNNFGTDARVTALLKKVRVVIVPVINPDGYIASREAVDPADNTDDPQALLSLGESVAPPGGSLAYRRKNCDGAGPPSTPCELQYGVDPNRNYGQNWGGPGAGTSQVARTTGAPASGLSPRRRRCTSSPRRTTSPRF